MDPMGNGSNDLGQAGSLGESSYGKSAYPGDNGASGARSLHEVADQAKAAAGRAREVLTDAAQKVRERASHASENAVAYSKDEPMKALLIAGAAGAILVGILNMLARSRD